MNKCIWNRNRVTDIENRLVVAKQPFGYDLPLHKETHWPCLGPGSSPFLTLDLQACLPSGSCRHHPARKGVWDDTSRALTHPLWALGLWDTSWEWSNLPACKEETWNHPSQLMQAGERSHVSCFGPGGHSEVTAAITEPSCQAGYGLCTLQTSHFSAHSSSGRRTAITPVYQVENWSSESLSCLRSLNWGGTKPDPSRQQALRKDFWAGPAGGGVVCFPLDKESF